MPLTKFTHDLNSLFVRYSKLGLTRSQLTSELRRYADERATAYTYAPEHLGKPTPKPRAELVGLQGTPISGTSSGRVLNLEEEDETCN